MSEEKNENAQAVEPELIEATEIPMPTTLRETKNEIDIQIATAKRYPRSIQKFTSEVKTLATMDAQTAASCLYALPRGNKSIEGPSARLAEIIASTWGNCRYGGRTIDVDEDAGFVTAQGTFFDLERNVAVAFEVKRSILDKRGNVYSSDMIVTTGNAAAAIAMRNAVLKGVPKVFWQDGYRGARDVAIGKDKPIEERRAKMLEAFDGIGVEESRVLRAVDCDEIEQLGDRELLILRGTWAAIDSGELTVDGAFPKKSEPIREPKTKED